MIVEWALESIANPWTIISLSRKSDLFSMHAKVQPGIACPVAVINLLAAQERRPEPTQVVKPLELCKGMEQPVAESPTREGKNCKRAVPMAHPK